MYEIEVIRIEKCNVKSLVDLLFSTSSTVQQVSHLMDRSSANEPIKISIIDYERLLIGNVTIWKPRLRLFEYEDHFDIEITFEESVFDSEVRNSVCDLLPNMKKICEESTIYFGLEPASDINGQICQL